MAKFNLVSRKRVTREIGEGEDAREVAFYPISVFTLGKLREPLTRLAGAFTTLLAGGKSDAGHTVEDFEDESGMRGNRFVQNAVDPRIATLRTEQRERAVREAIDVLLDPKHLLAVGEVVMSSMRDEDLPKRPSSDDVREFVDGLEIPVLLQLIAGVASANASVFTGDLGKAVAARVQEALAVAGEEPPTTGGTASSEASSA